MIESIGKPLPATEYRRDAIHIAVFPYTVPEDMSPGQRVKINSQEVGIVDPFLPCTVLKGTRIWVFVFPGAITDLRHVWSHPLIRGNYEGRLSAETISE